jgi:hypothetical protein
MCGHVELKDLAIQTSKARTWPWVLGRTGINRHELTSFACVKVKQIGRTEAFFDKSYVVFVSRGHVSVVRNHP